MPHFSEMMRIRYQPIIRLADMHPDSVEVLVRGIRPDGTMVGPESIVQAMTGTDTSMALTSAIIERSIAEYAKFGFGVLGLTFAFNLPLDAMLHPDLVVIIESIRARAGLPAHSIGFELTERHPVNDIARAGAIITVLRQAGYGVALDDITPDMVNLEALLNLPIQAIKLDRSITTSSKAADLAFARRIAAHGHAHAQDVIAEGIETPETLHRVSALGITHGQGFLFARPLAARNLKGFLGGWNQHKPA